MEVRRWRVSFEVACFIMCLVRSQARNKKKQQKSDRKRRAENLDRKRTAWLVASRAVPHQGPKNASTTSMSSSFSESRFNSRRICALSALSARRIGALSSSSVSLPHSEGEADSRIDRRLLLKDDSFQPVLCDWMYRSNASGSLALPG